MSRDSIFAEISLERRRQDALYGPMHDDQHSPAEWVAIACRHLGLAVDDGQPSSAATDTHGLGSSRFRRQMLRVAAVAIAALEALERRPALPRLPDTDIWQQIATRAGETVIVVTEPSPTRIGEGPMQPYAVPASQADAWERNSKFRRVEPIRAA